MTKPRKNAPATRGKPRVPVSSPKGPPEKSNGKLSTKTLRRVMSGAIDLQGKPTKRAQEATEEAGSRVRARKIPVAVDFHDDSGAIGAPEGDLPGHVIRLLDAFGTTSYDFVSTQLGALEYSNRQDGTARGESSVDLNAALAFVAAVRPDNELEATLAMQMAGTHALAMNMLGRARHTDMIPKAESYTNMAVKLQRTFTAQLEALGRLRGKGQQTVRVEHVTVQPGAQAIVGDVHHHSRGAKVEEKTGDQCHAAPTSAERAALPSPDPLGNGLPIPGREREAALQDARRDEPGAGPRKSKRAQARPVHE